MEAKITKFIQEKIGPEFTVGPDDNIFKSGLVNSMFALQLITFLESEFNIKVANEDLNLKNFSSVNNMMEFLSQKQSVNP